jgi:hypothetical protein
MISRRGEGDAHLGFEGLDVLAAQAGNDST